MAVTSYSSMTCKYICALILIGALSITAILTTYMLIKTVESGDIELNICGSQRMLVQKAALTGLELVEGAEPPGREALRDKLLETINLIEKNHNGLVYGDDSLKLPGNPSLRLREIYFGSPLGLDEQIREFIDDGMTLANDSDLRLTPGNPHLADIIGAANGNLLLHQEYVLKQYRKEIEEKAFMLYLAQILTQGVLLAVLLLEAVFVFRPIVRTIVKERQQIELTKQDLHQLILMDGLTGIANRRYFDDYFNEAWRQASRENKPLSLIMGDIDYFKTYNDSCGHQAGDDCLRLVAAALSSVIKRPGDLVARYGGEEFAVILPDTDNAGAVFVSEELRAKVESLGITHAKSGVSDCLTLSFGVATRIPQPDSTPHTLISEADRALYLAKQEGRNRINTIPV